MDYKDKDFVYVRNIDKEQLEIIITKDGLYRYMNEDDKFREQVIEDIREHMVLALWFFIYQEIVEDIFHIER